MNQITFKDKEGFDINVLAFDGEANFAILEIWNTLHFMMSMGMSITI